MLLLGLAVAISIQIIGALLVLSVMCTPAAAAMRVTASPRKVPLLSMLFGFVAVIGGILLALGGSVPISPYVTTVSFAIYLVCRGVGRRRARRGWAQRAQAVATDGDVEDPRATAQGVAAARG
jgi:zinc/manganese transport system permease protein